MTENNLSNIAQLWKDAGFKKNIDVSSKDDCADVVAHCVNLMYPTDATVRKVLILCENDRDTYVELLQKRLPNLHSLSGRGLAIYSAASFTRAINVNYNCAFIIRDKIGWNAAEELAIGSSKFMLKLHVSEVATHSLPPVEKGDGDSRVQPIAVQPIKLSVPVREVRYAIDFEPAVRADYDIFSKYIEQTYSIFGSQRNMERAYMGDYKNNMSAEQVCDDIATSNGWSPQLDMTQVGNQFIDEMYSPLALRERVKTTYTYGRSRAKLLTDCNDKIPIICDILEQYQGGCLILSKAEEFTNKIVKDLNEHFNQEVCLPFHDAIPSLTITGKNGKPKPYGARSQSKDNLADFHCGRVWALSAKGGSLWKDIPFICRAVIITSPLACDLQTIIKRCPDATFGNATEIALFKIFVNDTIEENVILRQSDAPDYEQIGGIKRTKIESENSAVFLTF